MRKERNENQGSLLIAVVGILAVLSMMAVTFGLTMRLESRATANLLSNYKLRVLARGLLNKAIAVVFQYGSEATKSSQGWNSCCSGTSLDLDYDGINESEYVSDTFVSNCEYAMRIEDAASMIYINSQGTPECRDILEIVIDDLNRVLYGTEPYVNDLGDFIVNQHFYSIDQLKKFHSYDKKLKSYLVTCGNYINAPMVINPNTVKLNVIKAVFSDSTGDEYKIRGAIKSGGTSYNTRDEIRQAVLKYLIEEYDSSEWSLEKESDGSGIQLNGENPNVSDVARNDNFKQMCLTVRDVLVATTLYDGDTRISNVFGTGTNLLDLFAVKNGALYYQEASTGGCAPDPGDNPYELDKAKCYLCPRTHIFRITLRVSDPAAIFGDIRLEAYIQRKETDFVDQNPPNEEYDYDDEVDILSVRWLN